MASWADEPAPEQESALRSLFGALKKKKPHGWSVTWGEREIVVRPSARELGKFSVTCCPEGRFSTAFFSRLHHYWAAREYFSQGDVATLENILNWMTLQTEGACGAERLQGPITPVKE